MYLYCVRHGQSTFNAENRIQGQLDPPLSDLGRRQAEVMAEKLAQFPIEAIYASPLDRAHSTAKPLAKALGLEIQTDDRLKEINVGIYQGLLWAEVREQHPEFAEKWTTQDPDFVIPQGESRRQLMQRGAEVLTMIQEAGHKHVAVVSHGAILTAAFKALFAIPVELNPFSLHNASITKIRWDGQYRLRLYNHVQHLVDAGVPPEGLSAL